MPYNPYGAVQRALENTQNTIRYIGSDIANRERTRGALGLQMAKSGYEEKSQEAQLALKKEQFDLLKKKNPIVKVGDVAGMMFGTDSPAYAGIIKALGENANIEGPFSAIATAFSKLYPQKKHVPYGQTKAGYEEGLRNKLNIERIKAKGFFTKEDYKDALKRVRNIDKILLRGSLKDADGIETPLSEDQVAQLNDEKLQYQNIMQNLRNPPKPKKSGVLGGFPTELVPAHKVTPGASITPEMALEELRRRGAIR
jgi:hypothetical protein